MNHPPVRDVIRQLWKESDALAEQDPELARRVKLSISALQIRYTDRAIQLASGTETIAVDRGWLDQQHEKDMNQQHAEALVLLAQVQRIGKKAR